jgi:hypothetical protein
MIANASFAPSSRNLKLYSAACTLVTVKQKKYGSIDAFIEKSFGLTLQEKQHLQELHLE